MRYYGIQRPETERDPAYIYWIGTSEYDSWDKFFSLTPHRPPLSEAIRAYEAIGYKCVELEIKKKHNE